MLTDKEKRELIYQPAMFINATVAIANNELRKAIDKLVENRG